ncbi:MAG: CDP-diacylglycerol--serine O-phosphatidyltransferase [Methanimicrococcus sp.]|nr:CDP-diacylglycerol--serine O-phosphatidyltransferase [Methanimicrococcus sp.]
MFHLLKAPDFVSILNLIFGMCAIFFAFSDAFSYAAICLLMAAVADGVDGYVARKTSGGPLGAHIDSLADAISFGVAPALLIYCMSISPISIVFICFYVICGVLRLARYNAFPSKTPKYSGIPITGACVFIASSVILFMGLSHIVTVPYSMEFFYISMFILSLLMISTIPYSKAMKTSTFLVLIFLFATTILSVFIDSVYVLIFPIFLFFILLLYLFSPLLGLVRKKETIDV